MIGEKVNDNLNFIIYNNKHLKRIIQNSKKSNQYKYTNFI